MDSASPIAQRTAGQPSLDTGIDFTFAMGTNKAENVTSGRDALGRPRGYREAYRRSYGEGRPV